MDRKPFTLVFAGGGARGYAHVGVLRALERRGLAPAGLVGVSMGAVVAATYALREDWYDVLTSIPVGAVRVPGDRHELVEGSGVGRQALARARAAWNLLTGWGAPEETSQSARLALERLLGPARLEEGSVPVAVSATDLISGTRVVFREGPAVAAVYASSALAGIFQPAEAGERLLVDGVYTDLAPVDVARALGPPVVIAVDPSQPAQAGSIENGLQAVTRAMEICSHTHAHLRLELADLVLRPSFGRFVDVLDFDARRLCIAAGVRSVRGSMPDLERVLTAQPGATHADSRGPRRRLQPPAAETDPGP